MCKKRYNFWKVYIQRFFSERKFFNLISFFISRYLQIHFSISANPFQHYRRPCLHPSPGSELCPDGYHCLNFCHCPCECPLYIPSRCCPPKIASCFDSGKKKKFVHTGWGLLANCKSLFPKYLKPFFFLIKFFTRNIL